MSFYAYYHIQIGLFEGGEIVEVCAPACALTFKFIAMYKGNVRGFTRGKGFVHLNLFVQTPTDL